MRDLWRSQNYRLLFFAGFFSELGTYISEVAILMRVFELAGHQKQYLGITQSVFLILMILGTLAGGVWGEGKHKVKLLLLCEVARIPCLLALLVFSHSLWVMILGNGAIAFFSGVFNPTRQAYINRALPEKSLAKANAVFSMSFAFLHAIGPLIGGMIYGVFHQLAPILYFDLFTYFLGIFLLLRLRTLPERSDPPEFNTEKIEMNSSFWEEFRSGISLVLERRDFFWVSLRCLLASLAIGVLIPLLLPFSQENLHLPDFGYGLLFGTLGLGGAFGGAFLFRKNHYLSIETLLRIMILGEAVSFLILVFWPKPTLSFAVVFIYGFFAFARIGGQLNFISFRLPKSFNSRANAFIDLVMVVPTVLGAMMIALSGADFSVLQLLRGTSILFVFFVFIFALLELKKTR